MKLLIIITFILNSCWSFVNASSEQVERPSKKWTFLVFVNGDNDLDEYAWGDLVEAKRSGSTEDVNIIFQIDRSDGRPCRRFYIEKENAVLIENMGEVDMGDYQVLTQFFQWGMQNYPAEKYALIIWNHGTGWVKTREVSMLGISYDDQSGNYITTAQLELAMTEISQSLGRKLDLLVFDACLMQMLEIAWPLRQTVDVMVGSEEVVPYDGFDYHGGFIPVLQNPDGSAEQIADSLTRQFDQSYADGSQGREPTTISWLKLEKVTDLVTSLNDYAEVAINQENQLINNLLKEVQHFDLRSNRDLRHLMTLVWQRSTNEAIKAAAQTVLTAIDRVIGLSLYNTGKSSWQPDLTNANGLAIYFPSTASAFSDEYLKLRFAQDNLWDEYIRAHLNSINESW